MFVIPHLILKKGEQILLTRRAQTQKFWPGHWHCVTGTIEVGESPKEAIIREAEEEIAIKICQLNLETSIFLLERDYFNDARQFYALGLFFVSHLASDQNPINAEPLKQDAIDWFNIDQLPQPMIPGVEFGLRSYFNGLNYAELRNI